MQHEAKRQLIDGDASSIQSTLSEDGGRSPRRRLCCRKNAGTPGTPRVKTTTFDDLPLFIHPDGTRSWGLHQPEREGALNQQAQREELLKKEEPLTSAIKPPSGPWAFASWRLRPPENFPPLLVAADDVEQGRSAAGKKTAPAVPVVSAPSLETDTSADILSVSGGEQQSLDRPKISLCSTGVLPTSPYMTNPMDSLLSLPDKHQLDQHSSDKQSLEEHLQDEQLQSQRSEPVVLKHEETVESLTSVDTSSTLSKDVITIPSKPHDSEEAHKVLSGLCCKKFSRLSRAIAAGREEEEDDVDCAMMQTAESLNEEGSMDNSRQHSASSVESLDAVQEEIIICTKNCGMQVLFPDGDHDDIDLHVEPESKGIVVATPVPASACAFLLVKKLLQQGQDIPTVVMLLRSDALVSTSFSEVARRFLDMGVDDVIVQPSHDADMDVVLKSSLCRLEQRKAKLNAARERGAALLWSSVGNICPNLPKQKNGIEEPAIGTMLGRYHEIISLFHKGKKAHLFLAADYRSSELQALKCIPKVRLRSCNDIQNVERELVTLKKLRHPNVIKIFGTAHSKMHLMLLLEFGGKRNLFQVINSLPEKRLVVKEARLLWSQVMSALAHCHSHGVSHRNLQTESVAVSDDGAMARLISFGYAEPAAAPLTHPGSMPFIPPEVMLMDMSAFSATAADVWAMGIVLLEMLARIHCLQDMLGWPMVCTPDRKHAQAVMELFSDAHVLQRLWNYFEPELHSDTAFRDLLVGILSVEVPERWPASKVQSSPWLNSSFQV